MPKLIPPRPRLGGIFASEVIRHLAAEVRHTGHDNRKLRRKSTAALGNRQDSRHNTTLTVRW
jgi:hypothetical protein